ncbi:NAD(P)H-binding protein [Cohnella nanjingensis]|uniref:NAD(P)H-binding protein n=1 Tax=Cohnella nanjingensis TaxID=1387779 RepID=A0A7X0RQ39_9BACL|nr:NAD(P)H-binding protein [Cohnella nanjingensis]MBB6670350.1 NAD(P)H-binding protein [Cohnella nanjingensis]
MNRSIESGFETNRTEKPFLILGGTGKTGRRVAERLAKQGLPVRIGSRSGEPSFDWENPATWLPALKDVRAVYIAFYPDLAVPGAAAAIGTFARLAVGRGVRRLVLLSGRGEEEAQLSEQALKDSGAEWTILRASWFCQNFSESFLQGMVLGGEVALPADEVTEPFVDADDIADVAAAALTDDRHIGQLYELTGPRALTFAEATAAVAQASGREIRYTPLTHEAFLAMLEEQQVPGEYVALLSYLFSTVLDGRNAHLTDGVQRALGREPRDFAVFANTAAAAGAWEVDVHG